MKYFNGLFPLVLIATATIIGLYAIYQNNIMISLLFLILVLLLVPVIVYAYCCKCTCRKDNCAHIIPSMLTIFLPKRKQTKYTTSDYLMLTGSLLIIFGFPQFWLVDHPALLVVFWSLTIIASGQILLFLCNKCTNKRCALCRNKLME